PEIEIFSVLPIIERFDPESISRKQQLLLTQIPNGSCKHPSQMRDIVFTKVFIKMDNTFSIRVGGKSMPAFQQFVPEFPIIVNLTIEDDGHRAVLVVDRLTPAIDINDCQTSHTQSDMVAEEKSVIVRSSPANERTHAPDQRLINLPRLCMNGPYNATH